LSCSNDPKIEGEFVKAVDEAVAKLENAKTMEEVQAFADEILKLDSDATYKQSVIERCQAKAIQYDINVMADKYMAVYNEVVKK